MRIVNSYCYNVYLTFCNEIIYDAYQDPKFQAFTKMSYLQRKTQCKNK